jgi:hypothetical protein
MKKNLLSKAGIFNPRVVLAFALCSVAVSLAVFSVTAAPTRRGKIRSTSTASVLKPEVINSAANAVSPAARDLPIAASIGQHEVEPNLPPVKTLHPVPLGYADTAAQTVASLLAMPAPLNTFEGQGSVDSGGGAAGCLCEPPDTNGAVGPTQYVQMVNSVFSVYDKAGTRLSGPTQINALFSALPADSRCRATNDGDPVVVYDQLADRWLLSQFAVRDDAGGTNGPYSECVAISQTSDATGAYYVYDFKLSTTVFEDYPHFGLWPDAYYMTTHQFNQAGTAYLGQGAWAFERDRMLDGKPAQLLYFNLGTLPAPFNTGFGGQLPANLDGFTLPPAGSPNYFIQVDSAADTGLGNNLRIWKFHVDWVTPANSSFGVSGMPNSVIPVTDFARPNCNNNAAGCVPQLGDASQLDPIGDRLMYRLAYRNFGDHEALVLNHTVVSNATTGQMGPRWYEVRDPGGSPQIYQQSTFVPTGPTDLLYRWMGSVAMDRGGNMAIGYSTSSNASFPSIGYAGRLAGDSLNALAQGEAQMFAGTGPQHGAPMVARWGDYTDMTVDPVDDCTFWYTNEYYSATDAGALLWRTRVGSFKFPQCTPRPIGLLRGTITDNTSNPIVGASVKAGGYTATTNASGFYQFSPLAPAGYSATASATGYFSSSPTAVTVTNGNVTEQNFVLTRNLAVPTPTPAPPVVLQTVNPPVLNDPGTTSATNSYTVTWNPAEVTAGLASYIVEESTNYANPLFDNADGTAIPGDAASLWTAGQQTDPWVQNPAFHNSVPNSYFAGGEDSGFAAPIDTSLTLKSNITIPAGVGSGRLTFYSRYFNDPEDTGNVEVSTDGGTLWNSLKILTDAPLVPPADTRVQNYEVDLTAYKGVPIKLRFRFNTARTLYPAFHTLGWWVDDINVDGATWTQIGTAGPTSTSFNVLNKAGGHYYYRVRATYVNGSFTTHSNVQDIIVNPPPVQFLSAASRKVHGSGGPSFDVNRPLAGKPGIECRSGGAGGNHTLVYKFQNPITNCGLVSGASGSAAPGSDPTECVANVSGLPDAQYSTVTLQGVSDSSATFNVSATLGVLPGDTTGNGSVNSSDISQTQSQSGQTLTSGNFREDVTVNGLINSSDIGFVQSKSGTALP